MYEQKDIAKEMLEDKKDEWWRIVTYDFDAIENDKLNIVDWTHEREWRFPRNFEFTNYVGVQIILYDPECCRYFLSKCPSQF